MPKIPKAAYEGLYKKGTNKKAVLLIHGFTGAPYEMLPLAKVLSKEGYSVKVVRLPGHATSPEDFANTGFEDWAEAALKAFDTLKKEHKKVFVCGLSMGGTLTLLIAQQRQPDGIVPIAPAVYLNRLRSGVVKDIRLYFVPLLSVFTKKLGEPKLIEPEENSLEPTLGYRGGFYLKPLVSFLKGMNEVRKNLKKITCPALFIHALDDRAVPYEASLYALEKISSSIKGVYLLNVASILKEKTRAHVITTNIGTKKLVQKAVVNFLNSL